MAPPHAGAHMKSRFVRNIQAKSNQNVALHFSASDPSASAKSMGYVTHQGSNCRRWVKGDTCRRRRGADAGRLDDRPPSIGFGPLKVPQALRCLLCAEKSPGPAPAGLMLGGPLCSYAFEDAFLCFWRTHGPPVSAVQRYAATLRPKQIGIGRLAHAA